MRGIHIAAKPSAWPRRFIVTIWTSRYARGFRKSTEFERDQCSSLDGSHDLRARHVHLLTRCQVFQRELAGVDLVLAYDESKPRAGLVGRFQGFFQLEAFIAQGDDHSLPA